MKYSPNLDLWHVPKSVAEEAVEIAQRRGWTSLVRMLSCFARPLRGRSFDGVTAAVKETPWHEAATGLRRAISRAATSRCGTPDETARRRASQVAQMLRDAAQEIDDHLQCYGGDAYTSPHQNVRGGRFEDGAELLDYLRRSIAGCSDVSVCGYRLRASADTNGVYEEAMS